MIIIVAYLTNPFCLLLYQVVKSLDDHADIIGVTVRNEYDSYTGKKHVNRELSLSR